MTKENEPKNKSRASEFISRNWPWMAALAGVGAVGVGIVLTIRYLRERNSQTAVIDLVSLDQLEKEALLTSDQTANMLETGTALSQAIGGQTVSEAAQELAIEVPDIEVAEALNALSGVATVGTRRKV